MGAGNAAAALQGIKSNAAVDCPFVFWTDKTTQADFKSDVPASARALLGGRAGSILDVYGGEYAWQGATRSGSITSAARITGYPSDTAKPDGSDTGGKRRSCGDGCIPILAWNGRDHR